MPLGGTGIAYRNRISAGTGNKVPPHPGGGFHLTEIEFPQGLETGFADPRYHYRIPAALFVLLLTEIEFPQGLETGFADPRYPHWPTYRNRISAGTGNAVLAALLRDLLLLTEIEFPQGLETSLPRWFL